MRAQAADIPHSIRQYRTAARRGMTLLELMLVLALLVIIGGLTLPSLRLPFENQRLRKAGDVVRIAWNKARITAMKTGQIQMFCFEAELGSFQTQPYYTDQDVLEADAQNSFSGGTTAPGNSASFAQQDDALGVQTKQLPEGIVFASADVQTDARAMMLDQQSQGTAFGGNQAGGGLMGDAQSYPPILFYPDGTTSDAKLVLTNERQQLYIVVSLRSLTGVTRVSDLVTADEVQMVP